MGIKGINKKMSRQKNRELHRSWKLVARKMPIQWNVRTIYMVVINHV
jgi:hypothetical protein